MNHQRVMRGRSRSLDLISKRSLLVEQLKLSSELDKLKSTLINYPDDNMREYILTEILVIEDEIAGLEEQMK
jgi:hypothetical protein